MQTAWLSAGLNDGLEQGLIFGLSSVLIGLILDVQAGRISLSERLRCTTVALVWREMEMTHAIAQVN
jgi:hypothetical protein